MREIKFRAWDGEQLHNWDSTVHPAVDQIEETPERKLFYLPMSYLVGDSNDWNWMQYTGLNDKNGAEIYEGDIVGSNQTKGYGLVESIHVWRWLQIEIEGELKSGKGALDEKRWLMEMEGWNECEVIGNIYENPELLES